MPFDGTSFHRNEALDRIEAAIELIADERHWCKGSLVNAAGQRCVIGALLSAHSDVVLLKPLVLQAAHEITGRTFRTVESFNDHHATTHAVVLEVLRRTRDNIETGRASLSDQPQPVQTRCRLLLQRLQMMICSMV